MDEEFKLSDWSIVITNGLWLVGQLSGKRLSPVFQVHTTLLEGPQGIQQPIKLTPFLCLGLRSLQIPADALVIGLENFSAYKMEWMAQIRMASRQDDHARVQSLGLVVQ